MMAGSARPRAVRSASAVTVETIVTERLELVSLSPAFLDEVLEGDRSVAEEIAGVSLPETWPTGHDESSLRLRVRQLREDPGAQEWLGVRAIALRRPGRPMIGHAGFHGRPGVNAARLSDAVELGYTVFEPFRRQGYATEAVRGLIRWAHDERGIRRFLASVAPGNGPSLAILARLDFAEIGRHWDPEDGDELEFELVLY